MTSVLGRSQKGDPQAASELLPLVYDALRRLAAAKLAQEQHPQTLQPTALVHEAWLRVAGSNKQTWEGRRHFFAAAAEAMRRILIERARRKAASKRKGSIDHEELDESRIQLQAPADEILAVNEALKRLAGQEPAVAEIVKMRYFVGMTVPEIADSLNVSVSTVERQWRFARAWLRAEIKGGASSWETDNP